MFQSEKSLDLKVESFRLNTEMNCFKMPAPEQKCQIAQVRFDLTAKSTTGMSTLQLVVRLDMTQQ